MPGCGLQAPVTGPQPFGFCRVKTRIPHLFLKVSDDHGLTPYFAAPTPPGDTLTAFLRMPSAL